MSNKVFLVPAQKGLIIRDPVTKQALPETGDYKPWIGVDGKYWRRRVMDGSAKVAIKKSSLDKEAKKINETYDEIETKTKKYKR